MQWVQKREVWLPTGVGWLMILALAAALAAAALRFLYPLLAVSEPVGAPIAVVEGWLDPAELDAAAAAIRRGRYSLVVTTGGPLHLWPQSPADATFAHRAAEYLRRRGVANVAAAPSPITRENRTYKSALMVKEWARHAGVDATSLDVFSRGPHARRSRMLYRLAFGERASIGVVAVPPDAYDERRWWRSSVGAREVLEQATGILWTLCFFRPRPM